MNIEIHKPELVALIAQRMESGAFRDVEDALLHALKSTPVPNPNPPQSLVEICAMVKGLNEDVDFSRNPSMDRPLGLA
jgi:hypothetical protein